MRYHRDAYEEAIEKVRSAHRGTVSPAQIKIQCPRCGTRQIVLDSPGMRKCLKCGFEFRTASEARRFSK